MADDYTYKVLIPITPTSDEFAGGDTALRYRSLGEYPGRRPEDAIEAAARHNEEAGMALLQGRSLEGPAVAVPLNRWHEREVSLTQRVEFDVKRPDESEPEPPE